MVDDRVPEIGEREVFQFADGFVDGRASRAHAFEELFETMTIHGDRADLSTPRSC
jgi:hypothetical protein